VVDATYSGHGNIFDALRPMIQNGPLSEVIPKTNEDFVRLPGGPDCRIEAVTAKATSRLGQRPTFVPWDETGLYTRQNQMWRVFNTQKRGVTAVGGRGVETTNPYDPAVENIAKNTYESAEKDIYKQYTPPPEALDFALPSDREKMLRHNYQDAPWALRNISAIMGDVNELMLTDPGEAERFYGNRIVAGSNHWMGEAEWMAKAADGKEGRPKPIIVKPRTAICLGADLSNNNDWTGFRAETADGYQWTPTYTEGKPAVWAPTDWGGRIPRGEVSAALDWIAKEFVIVRAYIDPAGSAKGASAVADGVEDDSWRNEMAEWAKTYGEKVILPWATNRIKPMHEALESFRSTVRNTESEFLHDGDDTTKFHIRNAVVIAKAGQRYVLGKPNDHQKIDQAQSSVLAHEAALDATKLDEFTTASEQSFFYL
jgi:hypothetical protein